MRGKKKIAQNRCSCNRNLDYPERITPEGFIVCRCGKEHPPVPVLCPCGRDLNGPAKIYKDGRVKCHCGRLSSQVKKDFVHPSVKYANVQ